MAAPDPPTTHVRWPKTYRAIPSRYPPIDLFERIAPPEDWELLTEIEGLTNERLEHVPPVHERVSGEGATWVMAPFTHLGYPSRFSDGTYGVYYAASRQETAIREVAYHFGRELGSMAPSHPPAERTYRMLVGSVAATLHDLRDDRWDYTGHATDYGPAQQLGRRLHASDSAGLVYPSVRDRPRPCLAIFRPRVIPFPTQGTHVVLRFDGERVSTWKPITSSLWRTF